MFDFHMHTRLSFDSQGEPESYIRRAEALGLAEICFTDHIDDDPAGVLTLAQRFPPEDYRETFSRCGSTGVRIRFGMEFGMLPGNGETAKAYISALQPDFVLGSLHYAKGQDVYYPPYWEHRSARQGEQDYLEDTLLCVREQDDFDVLGHLTYISKSPCHPTRTPVELKWHRELVAEILRVLVQKGKGLEINTSGLDRCGDLLPGEAYLRLFRDLGGRIVTVGSDAHTAQRVGQYTDRACALAADIFGGVYTFCGREPVFHKL